MAITTKALSVSRPRVRQIHTRSLSPKPHGLLNKRLAVANKIEASTSSTLPFLVELFGQPPVEPTGPGWRLRRLTRAAGSKTNDAILRLPIKMISKKFDAGPIRLSENFFLPLIFYPSPIDILPESPDTPVENLLEETCQKKTKIQKTPE